MRGRDLVAAGGIVCAAVGVALIYVPAALIIGGALATVVAVVSERNSKLEPAPKSTTERD